MIGVSANKLEFVCIGPKHQKTCGGQYIKIAEPEGYKVPKKAKDDQKLNSKLEDFFTNHLLDKKSDFVGTQPSL